MPATLSANCIQLFDYPKIFQSDSSGTIKVRIVYRIGSESGGVFTPMSQVRTYDYTVGTGEVPGTMLNNAINAAATYEDLTLGTSAFNTNAGYSAPSGSGSGTDVKTVNTIDGTSYFS